MKIISKFPILNVKHNTLQVSDLNYNSLYIDTFPDSDNSLKLKLKQFQPFKGVNIDFSKVTSIKFNGKSVLIMKSGDSIFFSKYKLIEYIQSSGTLYINTNYIWNTADTIECTYLVAEFHDLSLVTFGARNTGESGSSTASSSMLAFYSCFGAVDTRMAVDNFGRKTKDDIPADEIYSKNTIVIDAYHFIITKDSDSEIIWTETGTKTGLGVLPIFLFGYNNAGTFFNESYSRIYKFKITRNDTAILDLIPMIRIEDNVVGMYDLVSKQFFINNGTGNFIAGPKI